MPAVREHETVPPERTPDNPFGLYTLTPDRIRQRTPEELEEFRQEHERERAARYRWVYELLGLTDRHPRDRDKFGTAASCDRDNSSPILRAQGEHIVCHVRLLDDHGPMMRPKKGVRG